MLGRPSLNLLDMIRNDLKRKKIFNSVRSISDFEDFTMKAITRKFLRRVSFIFEGPFYVLRQLPIKCLESLFSDTLNFDMVYNYNK